LLNLSSLVKDKVAHSFQALAQVLATTLMSSARVAQEDVLSLVVEVVHAQVTPKLMDADTTNLISIMTVKTQMLTVMLDYQAYKLSEEMQEADVSLVLFLPVQAALPLVSALLILAMVQDQALQSMLMWALRLLLVPEKDQSVSQDTEDLLTVPIL
jgi:hypothetical protein